MSKLGKLAQTDNTDALAELAAALRARRVRRRLRLADRQRQEILEQRRSPVRLCPDCPWRSLWNPS